MEQTIQQYVVTPEQVQYKINKDNFKAAIRAAASEQGLFKSLRKPKSHEHNAQPLAQANLYASKHASNRYHLRHMYLAYAIFRTVYGGYKRTPKLLIQIPITPNSQTNISVAQAILDDKLFMKNPEAFTAFKLFDFQYVRNLIAANATPSKDIPYNAG